MAILESDSVGDVAISPGLVSLAFEFFDRDVGGIDAPYREGARFVAEDRFSTRGPVFEQQDVAIIE